MKRSESRILATQGFKAILVLFALLVIACGRHESSLSDTSSDLIKIMIPPSHAQAKFFLISGPVGVTEVKACLYLDGDCKGGWLGLPLVSAAKPGAGRAIFSGNAVLSGKGAYKVSMKNNGSEISRVFPFEPGTGFNWKSVFMAGSANNVDQNGKTPVTAWDTGRRDIAAAFAKRGFPVAQMRHLSKDPQALKSEPNITASSQANFEAALQSLNVSDGEACMIFMTSHGSKQGFVVEDDNQMTPSQLERLLDKYCGTRPTVAIVSACFSGINLTPTMKKTNRVILTAASSTRSSNGCAPGIKYNLYDECVLNAVSASTTQTWNQLSDTILACVIDTETNKQLTPSDPQSFIGDAMQNKPIASFGEPTPVEPLAPESSQGIAGLGGGNGSGSQLIATKNIQFNKLQSNALVPTSLAAVASGANYLFIDFSAAWCGPCQTMADTLHQPENAKLFTGSCRAVTLMDEPTNDEQPTGLQRWTDGKPERNHDSFELPKSMNMATAYKALTGKDGFSSYPTMILLEVATGKVINEAEGGVDLPSFLKGMCK